MRKLLATILSGALGVLALAQGGTFQNPAKVALEFVQSAPTVGSTLNVKVWVDLTGATSTTGTQSSLGGFQVPVAFDASRLTLTGVTQGDSTIFTAGSLTATDIARANARGFVTVINTQTAQTATAARHHVATLNFSVKQGGKLLFGANTPRTLHEGSLATAYMGSTQGGPALLAYSEDVPAGTIPSIRASLGSGTYRLIYPALQLRASGSEANWQGIVLVNTRSPLETTTAANLSLTAYREGGQSIQTVSKTLAPYRQLVDVSDSSALFGTANVSKGWIEVESTEADLSGFFLIGNQVNKELDGVSVSHETFSRFVFPTLGRNADRQPRLIVTNPSDLAVTGTLYVRDSNGSPSQTIPLSIPANGVYDHSFTYSELPSDGYYEVQMNSTATATGVLIFGTAQEIAAISAQEATNGKTSNVLCIPHAITGNFGPRYYTDIFLTNPGTSTASLTFRYRDSSGNTLKTDVTRTIEAGKSLKTSLRDLYGYPDPVTATTGASDTAQGYLTIESDQGLVGCYTYGNPAGTTGRCLTCLPTLPTAMAKREIFLGHVAQGSDGSNNWWTGLVILNTSQAKDATVTMTLYKDAGANTVATKTITIPKGNRKVAILNWPDYFGSEMQIPQLSGFLRITSNVDLYVMQLIGENSNNSNGDNMMSAVPVR